jgi:hypothetical protein
MVATPKAVKRKKKTKWVKEKAQTSTLAGAPV